MKDKLKKIMIVLAIIGGIANFICLIFVAVRAFIARVKYVLKCLKIGMNSLKAIEALTKIDAYRCEVQCENKDEDKEQK